MKKAKYKMVIFDFDGTIADILPHIVPLFNEFSKTYNFRPITDIEHARSLTIKQLMKEYEISWLRLPAILIDAQKKEFEYMDEIKVVKNFDKVIEKLHSRVKLGILSSNSRKVIDAFLQRHGMEHRFEFVVGYSKLFSKAVPLAHLMLKYNLKASEILYVGDEVRDTEAAKKVGMHCAAVTWGLNSEKILKKYKPTYMIKQPEELLKIVS